MADVTLSSILSSGFPYRKYVVITSSQTWTLPSTAAATVDYDLIGGGAAGSGCSTTNNRQYGNGGHGGRRIRGAVTLVPGTAYSVVIGAGGIGIANAEALSSGGATSAFGITAAGGNQPNFSSNSAGNGGSAGDASPVYTTYPGAVGASGMDGVCSGGGGSSSGAGGNRGGAGAGNSASTTPSTGGDATAPGCGGGGAMNTSSATNMKGGNGYRGEARITYWDSVP